MLDQIRGNLNENLARVESLVSTYEATSNPQGRGRRSAAQLDILRAAVVLLHASLEDVLRTTAAWKLPGASKETLNAIPLKDQGTRTKFLLGDLVQFRGKYIDEVLTESVNAYLERSNYNNAEEIASLLASIGVDVTACNQDFDSLEALMARRHQIVHRADRLAQVTGSGNHRIRQINESVVRQWIQAVRNFSAALTSQL